jgi:hypothetical protein
MFLKQCLLIANAYTQARKNMPMQRYQDEYDQMFLAKRIRLFSVH